MHKDEQQFRLLRRLVNDAAQAQASRAWAPEHSAHCDRYSGLSTW